MKILIPIDFSNPSTIAAKYACEIAYVYDAEIILLHAVYLSTPPRASVSMKLKDIENTMADHALLDMKSVIQNLKILYPNINISYEIIRKEPLDELIMTYSNYNNINLIVMGTKGSSGINKFLMGTNTTTVINKSPIPVLAIPEFANFNRLKKIVYASDLINIDSEIKPVIAIAKKFKSEITVLHVQRNPNDQIIDIPKMKSNLIDKNKYDQISIQILINKDIIDAIENFVTTWNPDMLILFTHKLTLFENIFGMGITQEISFRNKIPLLALKKNTVTTF